MYVYQNLELMQTSVKVLLKKAINFQPLHAVYITKQVLLALVHMKSHGWVHRDIKLENILINSNGDIKLCDFSLARLCLGVGMGVGGGGAESKDQQKDSTPQGRTKMTSYICTRYTRAPECFYHEKRAYGGGEHVYGEEVDVFSLGMCLLAMLNGTYALKGYETYFEDLMKLLGTNESVAAYYELAFKVETRYEDLALRLRKHTRYLGVDIVDRAVLHMLTLMLHPVPSERITLAQLDIYMSRFVFQDVRAQLKDCMSAMNTVEPTFSTEIIVPTRIEYPPSENKDLAKSIWVWGAANSVRPQLAFYVLNSMHLLKPSFVLGPASIYRMYGALFDLGCRPMSEARTDNIQALWDLVSLTVIDIREYKEMNQFTNLAPFVQCLVAARLCQRYHTTEDISKLYTEASNPELFFDTVNKEYEFGLGFEDFFKKYKDHFDSQIGVLKSWLRLADAQSIKVL
jgi:serine/threonine protein kinase